MNLSLRLKQIADFVPKCDCVADVGTDHGHLPIYLVEHGICRHAIAMDIGKGPLSQAEKAVRQAGLSDKIELRLADGLARLSAGEADTVTISGMGGLLITGILERGSHTWDSVEHFILSPQSEFSQFRHYLAEHGFDIAREKMLVDMGKYYVVVDVVKGKMEYQEEYEYAYGKYLIEHADPILREYLEEKLAQLGKVKNSLEKTIASIMDSGENVESVNRSRLRLKEIEQEIADIEAAKNKAGF